jgi:hypothetical protein
VRITNLVVMCDATYETRPSRILNLPFRRVSELAFSRSGCQRREKKSI